MKIEGLIWLEDIVEKLEQKHKVLQNEVREVLQKQSSFPICRERVSFWGKCVCCSGPNPRRALFDNFLCLQER